MHRFRFSTIFLLLLSLLITSCGGETVDGITRIPDEIDGLWAGSIIDSDNQITQSIFLGLSDSSGNLNIILDPLVGNASLAGLAFFFNGAVDSNSPGLTLYNEPGDFVDDLKFVQGSFIPQVSLSAELINSTRIREVTLELTYNATLYETPSSLALVNGTWQYSDINSLYTLDLEIDSNGGITGNDTDGCDYVGNIEILKSERNLYQISVDITCPPVQTTISTTGLAILTEVLAQDTLIYSVTGIDTTRSESVAFVERLTRQ